jgi:hypothetical protein
MKKVVAILIIVIVCIPSVAPAPLPPLGPNAKCVYKCFDKAEITKVWAGALGLGCLAVKATNKSVTLSADGDREAAGNPFNLGPNADCVYTFLDFPYNLSFAPCVLTNCFPQRR